jgi:hypothetical protein
MLSVSLLTPLINLWLPEQIVTKLGMYVIKTESISMAYFINPYKYNATSKNTGEYLLKNIQEKNNSCFHVYEWPQTEFGFLIGFIAQLQILSTSNCSPITNSHSTIHYSIHLSLLSLLSLHPSFPGNDFQWRTFPFLWVPELSPASATSFYTAAAHTDCTAAAL